MIYLLDTNTLVYALNRQGGVRERVNDAALRNRLATSSIVVAELLYGAGRSSRPEENRKVVLRGIERFQIVPFLATIPPRMTMTCRLTLASNANATGPNCISQIGWCPSRRRGVAVSPIRNRAFTLLSTRSNKTAGTW